MKKFFVIIAVLFFVSCQGKAPFAGLEGYAYFRADYPRYYLNRVIITPDAKRYVNEGNYLTDYKRVVSNIVSWSNCTITIEYSGQFFTCEYIIDEFGIAVFVD